MSECPQCRLAAQEAALDNYLDHHGLKSPHPTYPGVTTYEPLTDAQEAEVAAWADMLMDNADEYWHHYHA